MVETAQQMPLFDLPVDADRPQERNALDDLFARGAEYRGSRAYFEMLKFVGRCAQYSPFNAVLLYLQNPAVTFVATAGQWKRRFGRQVKTGARPLIILAPMRPVLFVYDLVDTAGTPMPEHLIRRQDDGGEISEEAWWLTVRNLQADGIDVKFERGVSQPNETVRRLSKPRYMPPVESGGQGLPAHFAVTIDEGLLPAARYAALVQGLGSIYCGHLGAQDGAWWKERAYVGDEEKQLEAESAAFIVCRRYRIETKAEEYLAGLAADDVMLPVFSLDQVLKVSGHMWEMGRREML